MNPTEAFIILIKAGWEIWLTSCSCGGHYAWVKPRGHGAMEMIGCICHHDPAKLVECL